MRVARWEQRGREGISFGLGDTTASAEEAEDEEEEIGMGSGRNGRVPIVPERTLRAMLRCCANAPHGHRDWGERAEYLFLLQLEERRNRHRQNLIRQERRHDESSLRENLRKIQRRKSRRGSGSFATNAVPRRGKHRRRIGRNVAVERPKTTSYIIGGRRGFVFCVRDDWSRQPRGRFESNRHRRHGVTVYSWLDVGVVFVRRARRVRRL